MIPSFDRLFKDLDHDNLCEYQYEGSVFKRVVVGNGASKRGVEYCLPLIFFDGTFLKSKHKCTLLIATTIDASRCIYPICYAIVEGESIESWKWFFNALIGWIPELNSDQYTLISDREKGIAEGATSFIPQANHTFCIRHICANVSLKYGPRYNKLIWKLAKTPSQGVFNALFSELAQKSEQVASYMNEIDKNAWTNAFSKARRFNHWTSNVAESFNSLLVDDREKPIMYLIDSIQKWIIKRFALRRSKIDKMNGDFVTSVEKKIEKMTQDRVPFLKLLGSPGRLDLL